MCSLKVAIIAGAAPCGSKIAPNAPSRVGPLGPQARQHFEEAEEACMDTYRFWLQQADGYASPTVNSSQPGTQHVGLPSRANLHIVPLFFGPEPAVPLQRIPSNWIICLGYRMELT
jgi:hypothetical protein